MEECIVRWVSEGLTNREIGQRVGLSPRTVQWYLYRIFKKVGVKTWAELAAMAVRRGLADDG